MVVNVHINAASEQTLSRFGSVPESLSHYIMCLACFKFLEKIMLYQENVVKIIQGEKR